MPSPCCFKLLAQDERRAFSRAREKTGKRIAARALIEKGRKNFVWIGELSSSSAHQRMQAALHADYLAALKSSIQEQLDFALEYFSKPTLVFANDQSALLAIAELKSRGLQVPEDAAVSGFDDRPESSQSTPPLTTVRQPMKELGREAAKMLLKRMQNKNAPVERKVLPVELILRASA